MDADAKPDGFARASSVSSFYSRLNKSTQPEDESGPSQSKFDMFTSDNRLSEETLFVSANDNPGGQDRSIWTFPDYIAFDYSFYRLFFLNMPNDGFSVSTLQTVICYQKMAVLLGLPLSKSSIKSFLKLQNPESKSIDWWDYDGAIKSFENRRGFGKTHGGGKSSFNFDGESSELSIKTETRIKLSAFEKAYITFEDGTGSIWGIIWSFIRISAILLCAVGLIMESMMEFKDLPQCGDSICFGEPIRRVEFYYIELVTIGLFTFDFFIRFVLVGFVRKQLVDQHELIDMSVGRSRFVLGTSFFSRMFNFFTSPMTVVDLVSFVPFYIQWGVEGMNSQDTAFHGYSVFRVIRLISIGKMMRIKQFRHMRVILGKALSESTPALSILLFICAIIILFFSVLIFLPEGGTWYPAGSIVNGSPIATGDYYRHSLANPDVLELTPFRSVAAAMYWAVITATTVGYGDMYPTSGWGRVIGICVAITGVLFIAMPVAVIGLNFSNEYTRFYSILKQMTASKQREFQERVFAKFTQEASDELASGMIVSSSQGEEDIPQNKIGGPTNIYPHLASSSGGGDATSPTSNTDAQMTLDSAFQKLNEMALSSPLANNIARNANSLKETGKAYLSESKVRDFVLQSLQSVQEEGSSELAIEDRQQIQKIILLIGTEMFPNALARGATLLGGDHKKV